PGPAARTTLFPFLSRGTADSCRGVGDSMPSAASASTSSGGVPRSSNESTFTRSWQYGWMSRSTEGRPVPTTTGSPPGGRLDSGRCAIAPPRDSDGTPGGAPASARLEAADRLGAVRAEAVDTVRLARAATAAVPRLVGKLVQ